MQQDTAGPMGQCVRDVALLDAVVTGEDEAVPFGGHISTGPFDETDHRARLKGLKVMIASGTSTQGVMVVCVCVGVGLTTPVLSDPPHYAPRQPMCP